MVNKGAKMTPRGNIKSSGNKSYVKVRIFNEYYYALADSGSPVTLISRKILPESLLPSLESAKTNLVGANGSKLDILGSLTTNIGFPPESVQRSYCQ